MGEEETGNVGRRRAKIDQRTGRLVEIESFLRVAGQESRHTAKVESRNSLFADFYGPWMVELKAGWSEDFELPGDRTRRYTVTGQETVQGRECFVVLRTTLQEDGSLEKTTFWVDRDRRVAVQVEQGEWLLSLKTAKRGD